MSSKLSEAQDAFFQAFAAMTRRNRVLFANHALDLIYSPSVARGEQVERVVHELLALSAAIDTDTSE